MTVAQKKQIFRVQVVSSFTLLLVAADCILINNQNRSFQYFRKVSVRYGIELFAVTL